MRNFSSAKTIAASLELKPISRLTLTLEVRGTEPQTRGLGSEYIIFLESIQVPQGKPDSADEVL